MATWQHKLNGIGLMVSLGVAFLAGIAEVESDAFSMLLGLSVFTFGIWGGILLLKVK
jgi:hypothetical protein